HGERPVLAPPRPAPVDLGPVGRHPRPRAPLLAPPGAAPDRDREALLPRARGAAAAGGAPGERPLPARQPAEDGTPPGRGADLDLLGAVGRPSAVEPRDGASEPPR